LGETTRATLGTAYIRLVQVAGLAILAAAALDAAAHPPGWGWLALTGFTAVTGAYAVRIPGVVVRLSVSEPIVFLATIMFGPAPGTLTAAVDALVMSLRLPQRLRTPHRILFNVGALAVTVLPSALLYFQLADLDLRDPEYGSLEAFVAPLYIFAISVFLLNSGLVAIAVSLERGVSAFFVWKTQFLWLSASYLASAAIAAILVVFTKSLDIALVGVLLPLIAVSFVAVRTSLGRLDDTNKHLSEVNTLYLSTIETLAMAIDAKDQVTHGHIRRVQRFAVGLARALGVTDDRQIRAIEAAALLHDMGKLAIPEFILNKPGRLTPREFAVMKTHAAVGADLLSSIQFPYPVVPIVRHHHESWDGSGYPDGIKGADIPLGARILSVVDCYDALTSDRPYRPALAPEAALDILLQRRGRMYDPLIVDTFVREHSALSVGADADDLPAVIRTNHHEPEPSGFTSDNVVGQRDPGRSLRLLAVITPPPEGPPFDVVCRRLVSELRGVASFDTAVVYLIDDSTGDANASFASGTMAEQLGSVRIGYSEQLTGWVAAHKTAVWNSDATLDLCSTGAVSSLVIGSSMPLVAGDHSFGAISFYGRQDQEVALSERLALESLLPTISKVIAEAAQRPALYVDCTEPTVRSAAFAALEGLLSHTRRQSPDVTAEILYLSVSGPNGDRGIDFVMGELLTRLSPRGSTDRCILRLSNDGLVLCSLDAATNDTLSRELTACLESPAFAGMSIAVSPIRTSLELQDFAKRVSERGMPPQQSRLIDRVH
jgi:putative nucleotidyltransferase with HDIG domain